MESLWIHTGAPTVNWEDNKSCISIVKSKRVTPRVKHIDIPVYFIREIFYNIPFVSKYKKPSVMSSDICTKPYSGPIMSWGTKWMNVSILYPISDTEHHQIMILHKLAVNLTDYIDLLRRTYFFITCKPE